MSPIKESFIYWFFYRIYSKTSLIKYICIYIIIINNLLRNHLLNVYKYKTILQVKLNKSFTECCQRMFKLRGGFKVIEWESLFPTLTPSLCVLWNILCAFFGKILLCYNVKSVMFSFLLSWSLQFENNIYILFYSHLYKIIFPWCQMVGLKAVSAAFKWKFALNEDYYLY